MTVMGSADVMSAIDPLCGIRRKVQLFASYWRLLALLQVLDFTLVMLGMTACYEVVLRHNGNSIGWTAIVASLMVTIVSCRTFHSYGLYDAPFLTDGMKAGSRAALATAVALAITLGPVIALSASIRTPVKSMLLVFVTIVSLVTILHAAFARLLVALRRRGIAWRRVFVVVDRMQDLDDVGRALELGMPGSRIVGVTALQEELPASSPADHANQSIVEFLCLNPVEAVVVKTSRSEPAFQGLIGRLRQHPRSVWLASEVARDLVADGWHHCGRHDTQSIEALRFIKFIDHPFTGWRRVLREVNDRVLALILLVLVSPVILATMIGIKIADPGPIFFLQSRRGYRNEIFRIIKFRTMRVEPVSRDETKLVLATRNDQRVFPFGRFLRRTSLDELPQLFNVVKGDMWLVGPRPHSPHATVAGVIYEDALEDYVARYRMKPGITGWAQVNGWRGPTETLDQLRHRVEHDLFYIENWSILLDMKILYRTLRCLTPHVNAF